jgi:hypothetical protein
MMWVPKNGPMEYYDVDLRIERGRKRGLAARITSIRKGREE